jgi:hypothetical protein
MNDDVVVLFKTVDPRRMSDPGPQLTAILDFKKSLEKTERYYLKRLTLLRRLVKS